VAQARDDAQAALARVKAKITLGQDPFKEREEAEVARKAKRQAEAASKVKAEEDKLTLRVLMRQWDRKRLVERRKSYAVTALRALELTFPHLLDRPVSEITRKDVRGAIDKAEHEPEPGAARPRGPGAARSAGMAIRALFGWAVKQDIVEANPFKGFDLPEASARKRTLSEDEARRVYKAAEGMGYPTGPLVLLLLLTGLRRDEIKRLKWSELVRDDANGCWMIDLPPERVKTGRKTGGHRQHLSAAALAVVQSCPRHEGCDFVFTSNGTAARGDVVRLKADLDRRLAEDGGPPMLPWVLHDLRRSLVSGLAKRGHNAITVDLLLGHKPSGLSAVAEIYQQYKFEPERRAALEHWGRIVTAPPEHGEVVMIARERRRAL
jgi:integrase